MLEIYEIIDRFELLYPSENIKNLRRLYVDKDIHSIFRLVDAPDDLRKAVVEKNLHSIFRLVDAPEDLRKAVLTQNLNSVFRLIQDSNLLPSDVNNLRQAVVEQNLHSIFRLVDAPEDLRKAVLSKNLHSIFRLVDAPEDLRKAVLSENLKSIFQLVDAPEDLRKLIDQDSLWSLWRLLDFYTNSDFIKPLKFLHSNNNVFDKDCFSRGQVMSKSWLVNTLKHLDLELGTVFLCAGWYATIVPLLSENGIIFSKIRSFDIDPEATQIAEIINRDLLIDNWKFKAQTLDIHNMKFEDFSYVTEKQDKEPKVLNDSANTVINTSCEHIDNFPSWYNRIPFNTLVVLQSNDYFEIHNHVNCHRSLKEFSEQTPMTRVLYEGELDLQKYTRFMRIGFK